MRPLTIAALALTTLLAVGAHAQQTPAPAAETAAPAATPAATPAAAPVKGDAARGRELIYTCRGCHGVTGYKNAYPNYHVPRIAGQNEQFLINALTGYKQGTRKHPTMQAQAQSFSEQDIADIAAYVSSLK
ncbi:cytochrome c [Lysobacter sp. TY2-98]|uniref:c-type cytochrome n=1 Tax=Lysobacter sp. TY2-98 TaxID=2290922 RepID=UPI000E206522|nr:cytochrome c [Lysobacter sp. TY2-98]AXK71701.1 cytochrome c [Lysobacter sp. TY2-98]